MRVVERFRPVVATEASRFFPTMKRERVNDRRYETREDAHRDLFDYIEVLYNRKRRHSNLGGISPAEFEALRQTSA